MNEKRERAFPFIVPRSAFIVSNYFSRSNFKRQMLSASYHFKWRALADTLFGQKLMQFIYSRNRLTGEAYDDVALLQAAPARRTVLVHLDDEYAVLHIKVVEAHDAARERNILACDAYVAAAYAPVLYQTSRDELRGVDGNRKADSLRWEDHSRVDAYDFAARSDERAAGVAWIERRVCLNDVINQTARVCS